MDSVPTKNSIWCLLHFRQWITDSYSITFFCSYLRCSNTI